ncbi:MAG: protein kinase, partial [Planctomycetota bacterium]
GQGGLAAGGTDNSIQVWDVTSGTRLATLAGHSGSVATLAARGDLLVSGSFDTTIRVWTLSGLRGNAQASRPSSPRH